MLIPHLVLMDVPIRKVKEGETVLREGTSGTSAYVLEDGEVVVEMGEKEITTVSDRGSIFGEMAVLLGRNRGATVTATKESGFYYIEDLPALLKKDSELSIVLLKLLAERIDDMNNLLTENRKWWQIF